MFEITVRPPFGRRSPGRTPPSSNSFWHVGQRSENVGRRLQPSSSSPPESPGGTIVVFKDASFVSSEIQCPLERRLALAGGCLDTLRGCVRLPYGGIEDDPSAGSYSLPCGTETFFERQTDRYNDRLASLSGRTYPSAGLLFAHGSEGPSGGRGDRQVLVGL